MANYSPFKANEVVRTKGIRYHKIEIKDKFTNETLLKTRSTREASRFLGAYELYVFHVKNGHKQALNHSRYDLYIDGKKIVGKGEILDKDNMVYKGLVSYTQLGVKKGELNTLEIVDMNENKNGSFDVWVKLGDLPIKYFCFTKRFPPTYRNVKKKIKENLTRY